MAMRDNYQPVIIKFMLEHGGEASKTALAIALLKNDTSKVNYYKKILMRWPKTTLERHGFFTYDKAAKLFRTTFPIPQDDPTLLAEVIQICKAKIGEWEKTASTISGSNRYLALANAHRRCQLCGISADACPLDVDHIVPQSYADKNGMIVKDGVQMPVDDIRNLQVLCSKCNRGKRDSDTHDFRPKPNKLVRDRVLEEISASGKSATYDVLTDDQFKQALTEKLEEEFVEFINAKTIPDQMDELSDLTEVIENIAELNGFSQDKFQNLVQEKRTQKGGFSKRILLKEVTQ